MKLLALDTSTDTLSIAVQHGSAIWTHSSAGGAQASQRLIPEIETLMAQAGLSYRQLDAIALGRGPGSFTGLRTACAVAQGLALGAHLPILPIDTLMALAQEAHQLASSQGLAATRILAALDARMGQVYANYYTFDSGLCSIGKENRLVNPENLLSPNDTFDLLAGNIRPTLDAQLSPQALALPSLHCLPSARAMLDLAPRLIAAGQLCAAQDAQPLYIRDQVALTSAQRQAQNP